MDLRVLGPVELLVDGAAVDIGPPRQRAVLAALAVDVGRPVLPDTMIDRVWGEELPDGVRHCLHVYVARLRRVLRQAGHPEATVVRRSGGYVLDVDQDLVDLHRFALLVRQARDHGCPDGKRAALLGRALELWRGTPLADLPGVWAGQVRQNLIQQRLDTAVMWARAELAVGDAPGTIPLLTELVDEHPLAEPVAAALIRAHQAAGNTDEALSCYQALRQRLVAELGVEPAVEVRELHEAVLRGEGDRPAHRPIGQTPAQLPLDVPGFIGRTRELAVLDGLLRITRDHSTAPVVAVVSGTAGVGKTALVVHWAHRVRSAFPDGQLHVDLRGFASDGGTPSPAEVIRGFLGALGVPPRRVPIDLTEQSALYRSMLTGRRVLVLLDNASDAQQVRPLLPGSSGCLVLVTSRRQLRGLVAAHGARPIPLGLPNHDEARQMLAHRLDAAEPRTLDEIVELCARLPLALAVAAARAATRSHIPLETLAAELRSARGSLEPFAGDDEVTDVRAAFSWSYRALSPAAATLFRQLGLHPGPDFSTAAAASLAGIPVPEVSRLLDELANAHLVNEHVPGRYALHDLLHAYAVERAHAEDSEPDRDTAVLRMLDHYVHTSDAAVRMLGPTRLPIALTRPRSGAAVVDIPDQGSAIAWFGGELPVLLKAVANAGAARFDAHAMQLGCTITTYLDRQGLWHDRLAVQLVTLAAAERLVDRPAQAHVHQGLGNAYARLGDYRSSREHLRDALEILGELAEYAGQADVHMTLGYVCERETRYREALDHAQSALDLYRKVAEPVFEARALNEVGWRHALLGDQARSLGICREALAALQRLGDKWGQAGSWDSQGYSHHHLDDYAQAVTCYRNALDLLAELGDQFHQAEVLVRLADSLDAAGDRPAARDARRRALAIFDEIDHPDADAIRRQLNGF